MDVGRGQKVFRLSFRRLLRRGGDGRLEWNGDEEEKMIISASFEVGNELFIWNNSFGTIFLHFTRQLDEGLKTV